MKTTFIKDVLFNPMMWALVLVVTLAFVAGASAYQPEAPDVPEGVLVFRVEDRTCIAMAGKLTCWCTDSCGEPVCAVEPVVTPTPGPRETEVPRDTPTDVPRPTPTDEPRPTPTDVPQATSTPMSAKLPCNRGLGNDAENCDPGRSTSRPGVAGEGDG